jgi:bifunctional polynucleotide phosphatase/kinase
MSWHIVEDQRGKFFYYQPSKKIYSDKILGLDLDGTLIKNESGKIFPVSADDWFFPHSQDILIEYSNKGYKLVVFTNQKGVHQGKGNLNFDDFKIRCHQISSILESKGLNVLFMGSTQDDFYRKPCTGMWNYMKDHLNNSIKINKSESIFVGDAVGRKGDYSDSDIKFAINIGIKFMTPEEFFDDSNKFPYNTLVKNLKGLNPVEYLHHYDTKLSASVHKQNQESLSQLVEIFKQSENVKIILMVGSPASGKTSLTKVIKDKIGNTDILSLDELKTKTKMKSKLKELLPEHNLIIDSTNATIKQRTEWLEMINKINNSVKVVCVYLNVPKEITIHLNNLRLTKTVSDPTYHSKNVPMVAIHTFWKKFEKPTTNENFYKIVEFEFEPIFKTKDEKNEFLTWF